MNNERERDPCKVACVVDMGDGTHAVLRCSSKEHPEGHRSIVKKFYGFKTRARALELADAITNGLVRQFLKG